MEDNKIPVMDPAVDPAENPADKKSRKKKDKEPRPWWQELLSWIGTILVAILIALVIRTVLFEPVRVDGHSMDDTLADGEIMLVSKFDYSTTWVLWPFGTSTQEAADNCYKLVIGGDPSRFDVVVCHYPGRQNTKFVKRVVGLPGDTVEIREGYLYVNGEKYDEPYVNDDYRVHGGSDGYTYGPSVVPAKDDVVTYADGVVSVNGQPLPEGADYGPFDVGGDSYYCANNRIGKLDPATKRYVQLLQLDGELKVAKDRFFVMGDHRNNSNDARAQGPITRDMIEGHVRTIVFPFNKIRGVQ